MLAALIFSGAAHAGSATPNRDALREDMRGSRGFESKTVIVGGQNITIEAPYYVDLEWLMPKNPAQYHDSELYISEFNKAREEHYPDEEIHLVASPIASTRASGTQYIATQRYWNVNAKFRQSAGYSYSGVKGVINVIQSKFGTVNAYTRYGNKWSYRGYIPGNTMGSVHSSGSSNTYGGYGECNSNSCVFNIFLYFPF